MDSIGCDAEVIRRVGGLEATHRAHHAQAMVIRRVGGLEESEAASALEEPVIRRVGGLEGSHPVLTGERKGTTLRERLERIRAKARKASVREAAEQWLRKTEVAA